MRTNAKNALIVYFSRKVDFQSLKNQCKLERMFLQTYSKLNTTLACQLCVSGRAADMYLQTCTFSFSRGLFSVKSIRMFEEPFWLSKSQRDVV